MKARILSFVLAASIALPVLAQSVGQDAKNATEDTTTAVKKGTKKSTKAVKKGYKKSTHATKKGVNKGADKVAEKTSTTE